MAKLTIKQGAEFLKKNGCPFSPITIRKAVLVGKIKSTKEYTPMEYYLIEDSDLLEWAKDATMHQAGRKTE